MQVDTTDVLCPITFVRIKVALDEMETGQMLTARINSGEPLKNLPRSAEEEGHKVLGITQNADGTYNLQIEKCG
ncbi:MAG: sulfurtransferase TusA family protein [Defluviitaleaceae bacterium]|nr:sulfurtransferase TusA family protein [Defluviitaleaceae bacterium]